MKDGTKVAGLSRRFIRADGDLRDYCVPVVTKVSAVELAMLHDVGMVGLAATMTKVKIEAGSDAVILGCGPLGLSAVQGARIQGAAQIIAVDPIKYRRDVALSVGATIALDPNVEGANLVPKIRQLCQSRTGPLAGGGNTLPDYVLEAAGGDLFRPKVEVGPDPTGVLVLQQAWQLCSPIGNLVTTGVGHPPGTMISFPAGQWSNSSKTHHPGNVAGASSLRDVPRFVRLIESGLFNAKALATATFPLDRAREAFQATADRTTVAAVVVVQLTSLVVDCCTFSHDVEPLMKQQRSDDDCRRGVRARGRQPPASWRNRKPARPMRTLPPRRRPPDKIISSCSTSSAHRPPRRRQRRLPRRRRRRPRARPIDRSGTSSPSRCSTICISSASRSSRPGP